MRSNQKHVISWKHLFSCVSAMQPTRRSVADIQACRCGNVSSADIYRQYFLMKAATLLFCTDVWKRGTCPPPNCAHECQVCCQVAWFKFPNWSLSGSIQISCLILLCLAQHRSWNCYQESFFILVSLVLRTWLAINSLALRKFVKHSTLASVQFDHLHGLLCSWIISCNFDRQIYPTSYVACRELLMLALASHNGVYRSFNFTHLQSFRSAFTCNFHCFVFHRHCYYRNWRHLLSTPTSSPPGNEAERRLARGAANTKCMRCLQRSERREADGCGWCIYSNDWTNFWKKKVDLSSKTLFPRDVTSCIAILTTRSANADSFESFIILLIHDLNVW